MTVYTSREYSDGMSQAQINTVTFTEDYTKSSVLNCSNLFL